MFHLELQKTKLQATGFIMGFSLSPGGSGSAMCSLEGLVCGQLLTIDVCGYTILAIIPLQQALCRGKVPID